MQNNSYSDVTPEGGLLIRDLIFKYLKYWKLFVFFIALFLILAKVYLRYSIPVYKAVATIQIKDERSGNLASELSAFQDLGLFSGSKKNLYDELEVLKSNSLVEKTVKRGNFNIVYLAEGRIKSSDIYGGNPIEIDFKKKDEFFYKKDTTINVVINSNKTFELFNQKNTSLGTYNFGQVIESKNLGPFVIKEKNVINDEGKIVNHEFNEKKVSISLYSLKNVSNAYKASLSVEPLSKFSNVVEITTTNAVTKKAEDFLNKLVEIYNEDAIADKNLISEKTAKFINDRLAIITQELDGVEHVVEDYKNKNKITDLQTEAEIYLKDASEYQTEKATVTTQVRVIDLMQDYLKKAKSDDIIPANIIPNDDKSSLAIAEYNNLIIERNRLLKSSTEENPLVIRLTDKINTLRINISESLSRLKTSLVVKNRGVDNQGGVLKNRISKLPKQEREFRGILRQQQIKEELYLYLFKKREETAISLAGTAPVSKVIDKAYSLDSPVAPKRQLIYILALAFGFLIPFGIVYVLDILNNKVKSKLDIEYLGIPFLGDVPHSDTNNEIIQPNSRTSSAEAIRIVRTNLEFILNNVDSGKAKTIFATSTIPGEGKTFIAVNLAATIALSGKKVLLIGMDVRNPKLSEYIEVPYKGLTNYLSSKDSNLDEYIVRKEGYQHFDVLPAGVIPPNPAELLMGQKVEQMFNTLKTQYDYIVVDTAPVSLVTDTLLVAANADAFLYVIRANHLEKPMLKTPETLYREKKLPNMSVILNDTDISAGYGYGYGYSYTKRVTIDPWYKKILKLLKMSK